MLLPVITRKHPKRDWKISLFHFLRSLICLEASQKGLKARDVSSSASITTSKHPKRDWKIYQRSLIRNISCNLKHPKRDWKSQQPDGLFIRSISKHPKRDWKLFTKISLLHTPMLWSIPKGIERLIVLLPPSSMSKFEASQKGLKVEIIQQNINKQTRYEICDNLRSIPKGIERGKNANIIIYTNERSIPKGIESYRDGMQLPRGQWPWKHPKRDWKYWKFLQ